MKNPCICILLLIILTLSGCTQVKIVENPQGSKVPSPEHIAQDNSQLSAAYFYLESRTHAKNDETRQAIVSMEKAIEKDPDSAFLKRDLIGLYLKQKKKDKALMLAEKLVEQDPENVNNLLLLVRLKKKDGQEKQLSGLLKKILELDPRNKETYLRLGKIYMENQNLPQAIDLFTQMVEQFPDYYVAHFYLGEANLLLNSDEPAKQAFLKTIELEPDLVEPRFRLIDIYKNQEKNTSQEKILEFYQEILEIEPENDRAVLEMALLYYKSNQEDKALYLFTELGNETEDNSRLAMVAVDTFITKKRYEDAVIVFSQMLKADPDNANLNFFTGMAYEAVKDADTAIKHYLKVTPEHTQYKKTLLTIAFLYRDLGKTDQAIQFLEQHHAKAPKDIDILSFLASFYEEKIQYDKAMAILEKGLEDTPDNTTLLFRLGAIQDKAGLRDQCIQTMEKVIQIDSENAGALNYLGYTYADMGIKLDQALELIAKAMKLKPEDAYITDSMGWVYYQKKDYEKAVHFLEKAAQLSDFETIIASHLADAYVKAGQLKKALITYQKALSNAKKDESKKKTSKKEDADQIQELMEKIKNLETKLNEE
jgi:tetratricopeptide (TPR) repeat protein